MWQPNYNQEIYKKFERSLWLTNNPSALEGVKLYYKNNPIDFINHWCVTYNPRNEDDDKIIPFIMFPKQEQYIKFLQSCLKDKQGGLVEKCRDIGASYLSCAFTVWLWLFHPASAIGWGSRKEDLVDKQGDMSAIFPKIRQIIEFLPPFFKPANYDPRYHASYMKIINPENGSTIIGEAGDSIGRGGRTTMFFKDESAWYEHPESIEAALGDNTDVQIDISSVHGTGNVFHRRRMAGEVWEEGKFIPKDKTKIFIFDWRDHPLKTQEWYDTRRKNAENNGLLHIFAQEVDRDYSASVEGIIIPDKWVKAAIDAHLKLKFKAEGERCAGLDVADEGGDKNALVTRHGVVMHFAEAWGEGDTGQTARKAVSICNSNNIDTLYYDAIGVGAGIKAETNRLSDAQSLGRLKVYPWVASAEVLEPDGFIIPYDDKSPTNKDFFKNLRSQSWWRLRIRFEKTYRAITQGDKYEPEELISLPSTLTNLHQLTQELSQVVYKHDMAGKVMIDKKPPGTKSPNLADACVQCYNPCVALNSFDIV